MRQSACLVINPIPVDSFAALFNCTPVWPCIRHNDGPIIKLLDLFKLVGTGLSLVCCFVIRGSTYAFLFLRYFSGIVFTPWGSPGVPIRLSRVLISDLS